LAIEHTLTVLSRYENLPDEDRPPEYLWEDPQGLEQWFNSVEAKRNDGVETRRGRTDDHAQDDQQPSLTENDHARFLKQAMA
jgi:hypothetical protein